MRTNNRTEYVRRYSPIWWALLMLPVLSACPDEEGEAPIIVELKANPQVVVENTATWITWTWSYSNAPKQTPQCTIDNGVGAVVSGDQARSFTLAKDTTFTLTCKNDVGSNQAQTTISTIPASAVPNIRTFSALPSTVTKDEKTTIMWDWSFANAQAPVPECSVDNGIGPVSPGRKTDIMVSKDTVFTLTCRTSVGTHTAKTTVIVVSTAVAPVMKSLKATPSVVSKNEPTKIKWEWSYTNEPTPLPTCVIDNEVGTVSSGGSTEVTLSDDAEFTVTCTNGAGAHSAKTAITTVDDPVAPIIESLRASPSSVTENETRAITWTWTFTNSPTPTPSCSIDNGTGTLTSGGVRNVTLSADTPFTLTCSNDAGTDTAETTVQTVSSAVAPEMVSFGVSSSTVTLNEATPIVWTWKFANSPSPAPTCQIDNGVGSVKSGDERSISLVKDTTFTLTCTNAGGSVTAKRTITAVPKPVAPVIVSLDASPNSVTEGESTTITWTWRYENSPTPTPTCVIDRGVGTIASGGKSSVSLSKDTPFMLTCENEAGKHSVQATIDTVPAAVAPIIKSFNAGPASVTVNQPTAIVWTWSYSNHPTPRPACRIDRGIGSIVSGGTSNVSLTDDAEYTLICSNSGGSDTSQTTIAAVANDVAPIIKSFTATPTKIEKDKSTQVRWSWSYENNPTPTPTCTIDHGVGSMFSGGSTNISLTTTSQVKLTCRNSAGSDSSFSTISVSIPSGTCVGQATSCENVFIGCSVQDGCFDNGGTCKGSAFSCFSAGLLGQCNQQRGCREDQECEGLAQFCSSIFSRFECQDHPNCSWLDFSGRCSGIAASCFTQSKFNCEKIPGCRLRDTCEGVATSCSLVGAGCDTQAGCFSSGGCGGSAKACSSYNTSSACSSQLGCSWQQ